MSGDAILVITNPFVFDSIVKNPFGLSFGPVSYTHLDVYESLVPEFIFLILIWNITVSEQL